MLHAMVEKIKCRGEAELVEHAMKSWNQRFDGELEKRGEDLMGLKEVKQRLAAALRMRLEMIHPYIDTWPQVVVGCINRLHSSS
jgi:ubiquinone biosynthesis protein COQ9